MASWKMLIFSLLFASLVLNCSTSGHKAKQAGEKWINENFIKVLDKIEVIEKKIAKLETKGNDTFDVHEIIKNITHLIVQLNNENVNKFEEKFKIIEGNLKKIEKFEGNFENIEGNFKKMEKFEENFKNIEENFKKSEKCEAKLNKMESILLQLKNANDACGRVTSACTCTDNATAMPVKVNAQPTDFRNASIGNETKALNACNPNPCLHGGRCRLNSTGSGYECDCLKFRSGSQCENDECSVEKRCIRYKDTLYIVIEANLTWAEAKVKCEGLNMTLAMPKDEERTRFLRDRLRQIYPYTYLWIGLKRDRRMSKGQWEWVDGSALGEYTGGNEDMKSAPGSVSIVLDVEGDGSRMWLRSFANNQLYSICETRFSSN